MVSMASAEELAAARLFDPIVLSPNSYLGAFGAGTVWEARSLLGIPVAAALSLLGEGRLSGWG